jgi:general secretion pathway protein I
LKLFQAPLDKKNAGFTLIEALVALAIVAVALTSIGSLVATSARGGASIEARLTRLETARAIMSALPDRDQLIPGRLSGEVADHHWRIDVLPFTSDDVSQQSPSKWVPRAVVVTVQASDGAVMRLNTIRLQQVNVR